MIIKPVLSVEEKVGPMLQVDILLTAQYFATFGRESHLDPEKRLMLAVLEDAISCFREYISARDGRRRNLFHEAEDWILEENKDWLFSFDNICEVLGFIPSASAMNCCGGKRGSSRVVPRPKFTVGPAKAKNISPG